MAAGAWTFTNNALTKILDGGFDFDTDVFKVALHLSTGTQPDANTTTWAGLATSEHAANNGYTAGGLPTGGGTALELSGTTSKKVTESTAYQWTASGGSITAKWGVLYEVGGDVVCYCLLDSGGSNVTATDGNTLTITPHANGIFTLSTA